MNAINLYVSTCRLVMQADFDSRDFYSELHKLLPCLRQSLSCTVCCKLLKEPFTPTETSCQHHVCKKCIGGKKRLKPSCSWCKDYNTYVENSQIKLIIRCYMKLCCFIKNAGFNKKHHVNNGGHDSVSALIEEAVADSDMDHQASEIDNDKTSLKIPVAATSLDQTIFSPIQTTSPMDVKTELKESCSPATSPSHFGSPNSFNQDLVIAENLFEDDQDLSESTEPLLLMSASDESIIPVSNESILPIPTTSKTDCSTLVEPLSPMPVEDRPISPLSKSNEDVFCDIEEDLKEECLSPSLLSPISTSNLTDDNSASALSSATSTTCTLSTSSVISSVEPKLVSSLEVPTSSPLLMPNKSPSISKVYLSPVSVNSISEPSINVYNSVSNTKSFPRIQSNLASKITPQVSDLRGSFGVSLMPADSTSTCAITASESPKFTPNGLATTVPHTSSVRPPTDFPNLPPVATTSINYVMNFSPGTIFSNSSPGNLTNSSKKHIRDTLVKCNTSLNSNIYSVMYNDSDTTKFTIKRKPTDIENFKVALSDKPSPISIEALKKKKPKTKPKPKRSGCRCGNATPTPGKLTCCGQRCPCYVAAKACIECQCKGCRNPHRPGGQKVRPVIPQFGNIQIHPVKPVHPPLVSSSIPNTLGTSSALPCLPTGTLGNSLINSVGHPQTIRAVQAMHAVQAVHGLSHIHAVPSGVHQLLNISGVVDTPIATGLNMHTSDITLEPVKLAISSLPAQLLINDDKSTSNSGSDNSDVDVDI